MSSRYLQQFREECKIFCEHAGRNRWLHLYQAFWPSSQEVTYPALVLEEVVAVGKGLLSWSFRPLLIRISFWWTLLAPQSTQFLAWQAVTIRGAWKTSLACGWFFTRVQSNHHKAWAEGKPSLSVPWRSFGNAADNRAPGGHQLGRCNESWVSIGAFPVYVIPDTGGAASPISDDFLLLEGWRSAKFP